MRRVLLMTGITTWLAAELDRKLDSLPSDQVRYELLSRQYNVWREFRRVFAEHGRQPFGVAHPVFGEMDAMDFAIVLATIDGKKTQLERRAA